LLSYFVNTFLFGFRLIWHSYAIQLVFSITVYVPFSNFLVWEVHVAGTPISNFVSKPMVIVCASLVHVTAFYPVVSALSLPKLSQFLTFFLRNNCKNIKLGFKQFKPKTSSFNWNSSRDYFSSVYWRVSNIILVARLELVYPKHPLVRNADNFGRYRALTMG